MSAPVWDQEFFRRGLAGQQATGDAQEPAAAAPLAAERATVAELLRLGSTDPYRQLGLLAHLILRKPQAATAGE